VVVAASGQQIANPTPAPKGRGTGDNPTNRFLSESLERDEDWDPSEDPAPQTQFIADDTKTLIARNDSPDIPFDASINVYRGCEHGCVYCYARPFHEYLGYSSGIDFETRILVKHRAPELLREELSSPKWKPQVLAMSGVTDCYQPAERKFQLTRRCLEVLAEFRHPVGIVTKNFLVTRDIDLLSELARHQAVVVFLSLTTLDATLTPKLEPRASLPAHRLAAIRKLRDAGIPVGVMIAPIIPGLNDHEIPSLLAEAARAGATSAGKVVLRLPFALKELFEGWLERHFPEQKDKVLNRIRALRDGQLNDPAPGRRMTGEGLFAEQIAKMFEVACRRAGLNEDGRALSTAAFRRPGGVQLDLFGGSPKV
jgi:DNA repair photolyase